MRETRTRWTTRLARTTAGWLTPWLALALAGCLVIPEPPYGDDDTGDDDTSDDDTGDDDTADDDDTVTLTLSPLTNNTTYYFAVAAVTSDDAIGDFTAVVSAMPQETGGAAWLAGEQGGYGCDSCAVGALHGGGVAAVGLLLLAVVLRRTREMR